MALILLPTMAGHKTERYYLGHAKEQLMQYRWTAHGFERMIYSMIDKGFFCFSTFGLIANPTSLLC